MSGDLSDPDYLYHYTTASGLAGILSSRVLWATHIYFLNDSLEFRLGAETAMAHLQELSDASKDPEQARRYAWLQKQVSHIRPNSIKATYAASLSAERDSLSQWRAYCPGGGYAVGFPRELLQRIAAAYLFGLQPCEYSHESHRALISSMLEAKAGKWLRSKKAEPWGKQEGDRFVVSGHVNWEVYRLAPTIKHPSFSEEREWRIMTLPECRVERECFRESNGLVVPYVEFPLEAEPDIWRRLDVVAGPSPNAELAKSGAERLVRQSTGFALSVSNSEVPYRYW